MKEQYAYLDATPTHSYLRMAYAYPQAEFPYARWSRRTRGVRATSVEFELCDTGVFDEDLFFDVGIEYAKADADGISCACA